MEPTVGFYWQPGVTPSEDVSGQTQAIDHQLDLIVACGANTVCVPQRAITDELVRQIQARQLRLFVDWTVFAGEDVRSRFADSVPVDAHGVRYERDGWYVPACPNHPGLRSHHLHAMRALLDRFGSAVEGLWLDFIRFPARWESAQPQLRKLCFCTNCLNRYLGTSVEQYADDEIRALATAILEERTPEWVDWKCTCITEYVREVRGLLDASARPTMLGMFSLPWRRDDFDGAMTAVVGQDLGRLAEVVDCFSPMVYHALCEQPPDWVAQVTREAIAWTGAPVVPIVQAFGRPQPLAPHELAAALAEAAEASPQGVWVFTFASLLESPEKATVVRDAFRSIRART
jgi:hypothetical protein